MLDQIKDFHIRGFARIAVCRLSPQLWSIERFLHGASNVACPETNTQNHPGTMSLSHSFSHIRLIKKVARTQLNIRNTE